MLDMRRLFAVLAVLSVVLLAIPACHGRPTAVPPAGTSPTAPPVATSTPVQAPTNTPQPPTGSPTAGASPLPSPTPTSAATQLPTNTPQTPVGAVGATGRTATITIAAENSTATEKAQADYVCTGVNDNVPIQAAINALPPQGGEVFLMAGNYSVSRTIEGRTHLTIAGEGMDITVLSGTAAIGTHPVLSLHGTSGAYMEDVNLRDFTIDGSHMLSGGSSNGTKGLNGTHLRGLSITRVKIVKTPRTGFGLDFMDGVTITDSIADGCGTDRSDPGSNGFGIGVGAAPNEPVVITGCYGINSGDNGFLLEDQNLGIQANRFIITGSFAWGNAKRGLRVTAASSVTVSNSQFFDNDADGVYAIRGNGLYSNKITISGSLIDGNAGSGIWLDESAGTDLALVGNTITNNGEYGINAADSYITIANNIIGSNQRSGVYFATAGGDTKRSLVITGNTIKNNGISGEFGQSDGVTINASAAAISDVTIMGNQIYDDQIPKKQGYGLVFTGARGITNAVIEGNDLQGNLTGAFLNEGNALSDYIVRGNLGYVTENSGTATVAGGRTSVVANHGLDAKPSSVIVTPTNRPTNPVGFWYVDTLTPTQFTIHVNADPGASGLTFNWRAVVGAGN